MSLSATSGKKPGKTSRTTAATNARGAPRSSSASHQLGPRLVHGRLALGRGHDLPPPEHEGADERERPDRDVEPRVERRPRARHERGSLQRVDDDEADRHGREQRAGVEAREELRGVGAPQGDQHNRDQDGPERRRDRQKQELAAHCTARMSPQTGRRTASSGHDTAVSLSTTTSPARSRRHVGQAQSRPDLPPGKRANRVTGRDARRQFGRRDRSGEEQPGLGGHRRDLAGLSV